MSEPPKWRVIIGTGTFDKAYAIYNQVSSMGLIVWIEQTVVEKVNPNEK